METITFITTTIAMLVVFAVDILNKRHEHYRS